MGVAIVAVTGTLLGSLLTFLIGDRRARVEQRRKEFVAAVLAVLAAFVRFRAEQYLKIRALHEGRPDTDEAVRRRYDARSALTEAIDTLYAATNDRVLLDAAEGARQLAVELGDAAGDDQLVAEIGDRARQAHTALRNAAHRALHN